MAVWLKRIGVALVIVAVVAWLWRWVVGAVVVVALIASIAYLVAEWRKRRALRRFRRMWSPRGRDLLLVYSNSPHWQSYVEENWLPRWSSRAVVLNWSERRSWTRARPEAALFRVFAGRREFNPLAVVVPPAGRRVHIVRFWRAFRDYRHGKDRTLRAAEAELERLLSANTMDGRR